MRTLYFGPKRDVPSWYWVGQDIAQYLSTNFNIKYFSNVDEICSGSIVFWIKNSPLECESAKLKKKKLRIIFFPVDYYQSEQQLLQDSQFLESCTLLACHTPSLGELFDGRQVAYVDHYNKFGIDPRHRKPNGRFLWIGGFQYFPYIYDYLLSSGLRLQVDILTDYQHPGAVQAATELGLRMNLDVDFLHRASLGRFNIIKWTEVRQKKLLLSCAGAFDYKYTAHFNQRYKPPTKIQKYLASGIPTAINQDSAAFEHMRSLGIELCNPTQTDIWTSEKYRVTTREYADIISQQISLATIGARYVELVKLVC